MLLDALTDQYSNTPMGITAENLAEIYKINREDCEKFALNSHQKAVKAYQENFLQGELAFVPLKKGELIRDEHLREDVSLEGMKKLRPNFKADGVVTAATASGIVDGAASVLVASESFVEKEGLTPLAEIIDGHTIGVDPKIMGIGPVPVIREVMKNNNLNLENIDLFEINEAFAVVTMAAMRDLGLDHEKVNIHGGACALGHPIGVSGARIIVTLLNAMEARGLKRGVAAICIGGGEGTAIAIERI